ncbi:transcription antiterminator [Streptococcus mutans]|uniref:BglG family transcription antiterminator n=1 Tax=Streptococcus mutans TaxID=1309 RepID=UPI0038BC0C08
MKERSVSILNRILVSTLPVQTDSLQKEFNVSSRTIRNDILTINDFLTSIHLPIIQSIRSQGFFLTLTDEEGRKLKSELSSEDKSDYLEREERILDLILDAALGKQKIFLYQKEKFYKVSKSTMDEDMRQIRQRLSFYHIDIVSHPKKGLILKGSEISIRIMLYSLLSPEISKMGINFNFRKNRIINHYISADMIGKVNKIFDQTIFSITDDIHRTHFILLTCVWLLRVKQKSRLQEEELPKEEFHYSKSIEGYLKAICQMFTIEPSIVECQYIHAILQSFNTKNDDSPINWVQLQILTIQLIDFVEQETEIPFNMKDNILQQGLYQHMVSMVARVKNNIQLTNPLTERIKQSYGSIYQAVAKFSFHLEKLLKRKIIDDEIAFLTIYFSTTLSEINQENKYWYRAVVVCNHGTATGKLLAENLKEFFNIEVFAILNSREIDIIDKLDVDLVFSTVDIDYKGKPVLILDSIIQEDTKLRIGHFLHLNHKARRVTQQHEDYTKVFLDILNLMEEIDGKVDKKLYGAVEEIFLKNCLTINKREIQPMIQDILSDEHILITDKEYTWRDAIKFVAAPLYEDGIVTKHYSEAMIKSVEQYGPYIIIGPHLALAHARPEDGANQLGLSLAIFEKPVQFGEEENEQVQVIFCLTAVDSFSHLNIMKSLVNLIRANDKIEQLCTAKDVQSVKTILFHSKEDS